MPRELTETEVQSFRERLCEAFQLRFARHGYEALTMRALADDVGCSPMTPYRYFKDKDAIFAAARALGFRKLSDRLEAAVSDFDDPVERIRIACQTYLEFATTEPDTYRLMYSTIQPVDTRHPELEEQVARARRVITELADAFPQVRESTVKPAAAAHSFWAALHGVIQVHLADGFGDSTTFEEVVSILMLVLIEGGRSVFGVPAGGDKPNLE